MKYKIKETDVEAMQYHGVLDMLQLHWLRDSVGFDFRRRRDNSLEVYSADSAATGFPVAVAATGDYIVKGMGMIYTVPAKVFSKFYVKQD